MLPFEKNEGIFAMNRLLLAMQNCSLFKDLNQEELLAILAQTKYNVNNYSKGQILAVEEETCSALGIILAGKVEAQKIYSSGKVVTIAQMGPGHIFGEVIIFTKLQQYPATILAVENSQIMYIASDDIVKLCSQHPLVLRHFMEHLSTKILMLNKKIRDLSFETLRQKIAMFLLEEYRKQKQLELALPLSKKNLADQLGVQRPSLSRELINMRADGLIDLPHNKIIILDLPSLEELIL